MFLTGTRLDQWVDANGSGRSVETSSNGTGYNPSFDSSLFGGKGGVNFPGSKYLESPAAFTALNWNRGFTILCAGQYVSGFFGLSDSTYVLLGAGIGARLGFGTGGNASVGIPLVPCVFGMRWDRTSISFILNGKTYSAFENTPASGTAAFGKLQVGGLLPGGNINAKIAGLQIFDCALDDEDVATQSAAMQAKYGIADLPAPLFNFVADGNSLSVGYWTSDKTTMWDGVKGITGATPMDLINTGNSGISTTALTARAAALVDPLLNLSVPSKKRVLIVWEITNDLSTIGQTDTAAYANIKAYCQARTAAGWRVVVCTCLPRTQAGINANFETYRLSVNASIVANAVSEGWAKAVADIGGDATIGATGASDNTTYFNDKIHLKSAGHLIASTYVTAAITAAMA